MSLLPRSLWNQLLLSLVSAVLVAGVLTAEIYTISAVDKLQQRTQQEGAQMVEVLTATLAHAIITEDRPVLQAAIRGLAREHAEISEVTILDELGQPLAEVSANRGPAEANALTFAAPLVVEGETFGTLTVTWDLRQTRRAISRQVWLIYGACAATLVLAAIIIGTFVRYLFVKPVLAIDRRVQSLSRGDLDGTLEVHAAAELERLSESVNALGRSLRSQKQREEQLYLAGKVIESTSEGILVTDARGVIQAVNPAFSAITGYRPEEARGKTPAFRQFGHYGPDFYQAMWDTLRRTGRWEGELWSRRKNGEIYPETMRLTAIRNGSGRAVQYVGVFSDASSQYDARQKLHALAYTDQLTALPNRQLFHDRFERALVRARRECHCVALLFIDLDRFKTVNDTLGHTCGDEFLVSVACRLKRCLRAGDTIARLGGDEFTVVLPDLTRIDEAVTVARKLLGTFAEPIVMQGREFYLSASIGLSMFPIDGQDRESLLKNADVAMYRAKEEGRNTYRFYTSDMNSRMLLHMNLESDLRRAVQDERLALAFQPQVDCATGKCVGMEALARWHQPPHGWISPRTFIPIAEDTGLIGSLGEWVLRSACAQAKRWVDMGLRPFQVAVNVSGRQLRDQRFVEAVHRTLEDTGLEPGCLGLELTESVLMENIEIAATALKTLGQTGIQISIDDFGTGYSSLSYLKKFSVDKLKIDRSFVEGIPNDPNDKAIAEAIIAMADALGLEVIAEGVEEQEQLTFLGARGCHQIQGFLVGWPAPAEEITKALTLKGRVCGSVLSASG